MTPPSIKGVRFNGRSTSTERIQCGWSFGRAEKNQCFTGCLHSPPRFEGDHEPCSAQIKHSPPPQVFTSCQLIGQYSCRPETHCSLHNDRAIFVFYMLKKGRLSTHRSIFHAGGSHLVFCLEVTSGNVSSQSWLEKKNLDLMNDSGLCLIWSKLQVFL